MRKHPSVTGFVRFLNRKRCRVERVLWKLRSMKGRMELGMRTLQAEPKVAFPPFILGKNVPSVRAKAGLLLLFQGQRFIVNTRFLRFPAILSQNIRGT